LKEGDAVRVRQGERAVQLPARARRSFACRRRRLAGAALGSLFGELVVEKA
jgi:NADH-quinone oxidoreductase subunit G